MSSGLVKTIKNIKRREETVITHKLEQWLSSPAGERLGLENDDDYKLLTNLLGQSSVNAVRSGRFGASSRGMCHRRQIFAFLGLPVLVIRDPTLQNIFNDGTFRHVRWQLMLMKAGLVTDVEVPLKLPEWRLGISMDAVNDDEEWVFELKGTSLSITTLTRPENISEAHLLQIHTYLFATGWDMAIYLAEAKAGQYWKEVVVHRDEKYIRKVKRELNQLNECVEDEILPPILPEAHKRKGECRECPYRAGCIEIDAQGDPWPGDGQWPSGS